jgi:outer membrane lipoprotein carrier protein
MTPPLSSLIRFRLAACLLAIVALQPAVAASIEQLRAFTADLEGVEASFVQRVFDANERIVEQSRGQMALSRPNLFRWQYTEPFQQLIIADGQRVWVYDPDLEQVTVRDQSDSEGQSPLSVLLDPEGLDTRYLLQDLGEAEGASWLRLLPREEDAQLRFADLVFEGNELRAMHLHDSLGQRNVLLFEDWMRNPEFAEDSFRFEIPEGVDVVGAEEQ